ncbi:MAG: M48 family metallopeptidase [Peptococcaceae bacterium]|nr:M48 family metallopeptidase [Peptococcaceae bacterium]
MGAAPVRLTIRTQRTRWGSCSAKGAISLNALLMLAPETVRDYVVVHELCHLKEMNHSSRFWAEVARVLPTYARERDWLKENGYALLKRNPTS